MSTLLHIVHRTAWAAAVAEGQYSPPSLASEGFIHLSAPRQVLGTANRFYRDTPDLLLLLRVDEASLGADLSWEEGEPGELFPHLYRALDTAEVRSVVELRPDEDGVFRQLEI
jgi:uncharacterized protein (DUF952 family)